MNAWKIIKTNKVPKLKNPLMIEGLPGIGNVGKVAVDFIVEELGARKIFDIESYSMPHSVFVNEENLVELPAISIYHKKKNNKDFLLIAGDAQPIDEVSSYEFSSRILELLKSYKGHEIITLGGIGLPNIPKTPKVYCTGTSKSVVKKYSDETSADSNLYGVVGPIIGVSGLLLGLAKRQKLSGVSYLAETYSHPLYLGIRGAREIVRILDQKLHFGIDIKELDKEIKELESQSYKKMNTPEWQKSVKQLKKKQSKDANYIG